jgi:hypothetical protein
MLTDSRCLLAKVKESASQSSSLTKGSINNTEGKS